MILKLERSFSAAHFYHQVQWSETENLKEFGLCFTKYGHGHDYTVEVEIETEAPELAQNDFNNLIKKLDHQHLNFTVPEFKTQIPTTENIASFLKASLSQLFNAHETSIRKIKLIENPEIWVELNEPQTGL